MNPRQSHISEDNKNKSTPKLHVSSIGLFSDVVPLNQQTIYFITNPSEDQSQGSSLYFVSPHGTIRCRSDRKRKDKVPPMTLIRPNVIGYYKTGEQIQTLEAKVGLQPYEVDALENNSIKPLCYLNLVKNKIKDRTHHKGYPITEIISTEQFNDPAFKPKTWVDREDVGMLWPSAVNQIKKAQMRAVINKHGRFVTNEVTIPVNKKKTGCAIS